ncbi:MAG: ABC transporter ATP-binding protein [Pirellulales bacterium]
MEVRLNARAAAVFHRVSKVYDGSWTRRRVVALDDVSLEIPWGEVFGVVGPNRAGKTTLVKILLTICRPSDGRIMRLECPYSDRRTLAHVGYVHENPSFPRYLTAWQVVDGYGRLSGVAGKALRRRTGELLEQVGLADRSHERIAQFSKGMLQRLALAQALVNDPKLLVLDEPSEGMDLTARRLLRDIIRQRRDQGASVILVSHALDDVEQLCDRVAVLCNGRLSFAGRVAELAGAQVPTGSGSMPAPKPTPVIAGALETAVAALYEGAIA